MKVGKPKSKRVSVRLRHRIEKASSAKQRKQRKEAKKNPQWRSRLKKDPGIPNLFPHKDKVLAEIEEARRRKEEDAQQRREVAKAQRTGRAVETAKGVVAEGQDDDEDEELLDAEDLTDEEDEMDETEDSNPMAALLASAQARAKDHGNDTDGEAEDADEEDEEWGGLDDEDVKKTTRQTQPARKALPKQALEDPVKVVSALLDRLQGTNDGMQQITSYYQLPPLATGNTDRTTRFLVEVARKRGRLGRGGIPNLHSSALTVLGDLNDERLKLPALATVARSKAPSSRGEVRIVSQMAEPFRIEGLFGDAAPQQTAAMDGVVAS